MKQTTKRPGATLRLLLCALLLAVPGWSMAQRGERIHAIKVGYLTERLKLSPEQATSFWPVYDMYEAEVRKTRASYRSSLRQQGTAPNDAEAARRIDDNLEYQEALLAINKRYKDRFLKVLSPTQLAALYDAERDFRKLLLQQLRERRGQR